MLHVKFTVQFPLYSITSTRTKAKPRKACFNHVLILVVLFSFSLLIFHRTASRLQQFPNTWWGKGFSETFPLHVTRPSTGQFSPLSTLWSPTTKSQKQPPEGGSVVSKVPAAVALSSWELPSFWEESQVLPEAPEIGKMRPALSGKYQSAGPATQLWVWSS